MIRRLSEDDFSTWNWISELISPAFRWDLEQLLGLVHTHEFWGCFEQQQLVAAIAIIRLPQAWEIPWLATDPRWQRQGKMRHLLREVLGAKRQDAEIWLEVHEANAPARSLYRDLGFAEVGRRSRYYSDGGAAILLTLEHKSLL